MRTSALECGPLQGGGRSLKQSVFELNSNTPETALAQYSRGKYADQRFSEVERGRFLILACQYLHDAIMNIIDILRRHEQEIKKRFGVKRIGLFGSFARGDEKDSSDVDIIVEFEEPTFDNFMKLAFYLEDLFCRRVEVVTSDSLSPYIAPYVKSELSRAVRSKFNVLTVLSMYL